MDSTQEEHVLSAADATLTTSRALLGIIARSVSSALEEVTLPQFRVLVILAGSGAMRIGALAARMKAVPSTFSRTIDRMVAEGWVERAASVENRREVIIDVTSKGWRLVHGATELRRREIADVLATMSKKDRNAVASALSKFSVAAGEPADDDLLGLGL
ncbi:MarR family winged helix-turn-helix transcriptional regulator [Spelaeicoccus albus]|nr:MarR family transcriptional regulator [Spelaeicoccus albus]